MKPLVSILIPAYNAENLVGYTIQSAIAQTWPRKEIIVVNDGSTDRTADVLRQFASKDVKVVSTENGGLCRAVNYAYSLCQGDYIQELDADDLLSPSKIERQLGALAEEDGKLTLLSSPWAYFFHRTRSARFIPNALWHDLTPADWLVRKMEGNLHMQNATWLVSRELAEAAGPWDVTLQYDQDGEYFARVIAKSVGTRFIRNAGIFYRLSSSSRISYIGNSDKKKNSLLISMKLQIQYLRSLEDSDRTRKACLVYLQNWFANFYPSRPDLVEESQKLAAELGGHLEPPRFGWKYAWMKPIFGRETATWAQHALPEFKYSMLRRWDKAMFDREGSQPFGRVAASAPDAKR